MHNSSADKNFGTSKLISWPEFYADYNEKKIFWKFSIFGQKNPLYNFVLFFANLSTYAHAYAPQIRPYGLIFDA